MPSSESVHSSLWKPPTDLVEQLQRHEADLTQRYGPVDVNDRDVTFKFNPPAFMVKKSCEHAESLGLTEEMLLKKAQEEEQRLREALYSVEENVTAGEDVDDGILPNHNANTCTMGYAMRAPETESSPDRMILSMESSSSLSERSKLQYTFESVSSPPSVHIVEEDFQVLPMPQWYIDIKPTNFTMKETMKKKKGQAFTALDALKACIRKCAEQKTSNIDYGELRNHIHKAELKLEVNKYIIKGTRILSSDAGLPRIFSKDTKNRLPEDIRLDSYHLYLRWMKEDFSQDILRGIVTVKGKDRNGDRLDAEYRKRYPASPKFFGQAMPGLSSLVLGQWWPTQLCAVRDGAHGSSQGGIFGGSKGAYSIVLSSGGYGDRDEGDIIEYAGTEGKDFKPTDATLAMVRSCELQKPVRVLRSSQLPKANKYRPEYGLRYDGLYQVAGYVVADEEKQIHRFRLERCPGQLPIRCKGSGAERPTTYEKEKFEELKRKKIW